MGEPTTPTTNEPSGQADDNGLSLVGIAIRVLVFLGALLLLVIGGLFALDAIESSIEYYNAVSGCDRGKHDACYDLAKMYCDGEGVAEDDWQCQAVLEQACADGHARSCMHAGWKYLEGESDGGIEQSARIFQACESGDMRACHVAGSPWLHVREHPEGALPRARYLERACRGGVAAACHRWRWELEDEGAPKSAKLEAAEFGCERGYEDVCTQLGALLVDDPERRDEGARLLSDACPSPDNRCMGLVDHLEGREPARAHRLARKLCEMGVAGACHEYAEQLESGDDDEQAAKATIDALRALRCFEFEYDCEVSEQRAERHRERCSKDAPVSCLVDAKYRKRTRSLPWDYEAYRRAQRLACEGGLIDACSTLAWQSSDTEAGRAASAQYRKMACENGYDWLCAQSLDDAFAGYVDEPDPQAVVDTLEERCEAGYMLACQLLDHWYARLLEVWLPRRQLELAEDYGVRACELGNGRGCSGAGHASIDQIPAAQMSPESVRVQVNRYTRACEMGYEYGCLHHGLLYLQGHHARDRERGTRILEDYCSEGRELICWRLAYFYKQGDWVEEDAQRARTLMTQLCEGGDQRACDRLSDD